MIKIKQRDIVDWQNLVVVILKLNGWKEVDYGSEVVKTIKNDPVSKEITSFAVPRVDF